MTSVPPHSETKHFYSEEEKKGLVDFLNQVLKTNIDPQSNQFFEVMTDGILLCKLIQAIEPSALKKEPVTSFPNKDKQVFQKLENLKLALDGAQKLGCNIINVDPSDLHSGTPHLVLGLLWQIVRVGLLKRVAELAGMELPPEEILKRWFNYHLQRAGSKRVVNNFSDDLKDSEALLILLNQLAPAQCDTSALGLSDLSKRAEAVLINAEKIDCRKFITPADIVKGNSRLLTAFLAVLFSKYPNMGEVVEPKQERKSPPVDNSELERLRQENAQLRSEIDNLKQTHQKQIEELEFARRTSTDEISKLQKLIEELQSKPKDDSELEKLRQENAQLRSEIETLKSQLGAPNAAWAEKEAAYQKEKAELEARINQLTQQMKEHEEKLANVRALEEEKERLANEVKELKSKSTRSETTQSESLPLAPPERRGWMYKQTAKGRIIKRFFILRGDFLLFYRERAPEVVNEAKPRGALHLPGSSVREVDEQTSIKRSKEKKLKFGFELESRHAKRVYFIVTNDEQVRQEWVKALREAIEYYNRIQPPDSSTKTSGSVSNTSSPPQEQQSQKPPQEQQSQNTAPPSSNAPSNSN